MAPGQVPLFLGLFMAEAHVFAPNMVTEVTRALKRLVAEGTPKLLNVHVDDSDVFD